MNGKGRREFIIKDLVVTLPSGRLGGGTFMPADDGETPPWWISPVAGVLNRAEILDLVRDVVRAELDRGGDFVDIAAAFEGKRGNPAIAGAIQEIGRTVVASVGVGALGKAGMPNPECDGTSELPPTLSPIAQVGWEVHRTSALPRLREQLAVAVEHLDRMSATLAPQGDQIDEVAKALEGARAELGR